MSGTFFEDVYGVEVHLLWDCTPRQFRNYVRKATGKKSYKDPGKFVGICHSSSTDIILGFSKWRGNDFDLSTLAHETFHAAHYVLKKRGLRYSKRTEEAFAYFHGALFLKALKILPK